MNFSLPAVSVTEAKVASLASLALAFAAEPVGVFGAAENWKSIVLVQGSGFGLAEAGTGGAECGRCDGAGGAKEAGT